MKRKDRRITKQKKSNTKEWMIYINMKHSCWYVSGKGKRPQPQSSRRSVTVLQSISEQKRAQTETGGLETKILFYMLFIRISWIIAIIIFVLAQLKIFLHFFSIIIVYVSTVNFKLIMLGVYIFVETFLL